MGSGAFCGECGDIAQLWKVPGDFERVPDMFGRVDKGLARFVENSKGLRGV